MLNSLDAKNIKSFLLKLPDIESIKEVEIKDSIIQKITLQSKKIGEVIINQLQIEDSPKLFEFYFYGLSQNARIFFPPYPLFSPLPQNPEELADRIKNWKKEKDWTVLKLVYNKQIVGICLLKRFKTDRPTSGLAVHEKFQKMGLGILLQTIVNEQARLLGIKKLTITLAQDNIASLKLHEKAGFKKTENLVPHSTYVNGVKKIDRQDIEMIKELTE